MTRLQCFLACVPPTVTHHSKRIVRVRQFARLADTDALVGAKAMLDELLLPHQPETPIAAPVRLTVTFTWPWRTSTSQRVRSAGRAPKTTKPDLDNLCKVLTDRLAALRFIPAEDGVVAELHARKFWGEAPGIAVVLETVGAGAPS